MRWDWETLATEAEAEALQERIWDLHNKLNHAILALSACAGLPACLCRGAPMMDARGLHAIRAALEDLEGHLHFLRKGRDRDGQRRHRSRSRSESQRYVLDAIQSYYSQLFGDVMLKCTFCILYTVVAFPLAYLLVMIDLHD
ncbi:plastid division protein PDV1-like [Hordeum vulgare]|nr:plastid division protein PDV1-like [Hordeum vulgare]